MLWLSQPQISMHKLVETHYLMLYRFAFRLSGSQAEAEDLTQETFCQAQDKIHQLREANKAKGWLYAILRNAFLQRRRHQQRETCLNMEEIGEILDRPADDLPDIEPERLQQALGELPEVYRTPVILYFF